MSSVSSVICAVINIVVVGDVTLGGFPSIVTYTACTYCCAIMIIIKGKCQTAKDTNIMCSTANEASCIGLYRLRTDVSKSLSTLATIVADFGDNLSPKSAKRIVKRHDPKGTTARANLLQTCCGRVTEKSPTCYGLATGKLA